MAPAVKQAGHLADIGLYASYIWSNPRRLKCYNGDELPRNGIFFLFVSDHKNTTEQKQK